MEEQFGLLTCEEAFLALVCLDVKGGQLFLNDELLGFNGKTNQGFIATPFYRDRPLAISVQVRSQLYSSISLREILTYSGSYIIDLFSLNKDDLFADCYCDEDRGLCVPVLLGKDSHINGVAGTRLLVSTFVFLEPKFLQKVVSMPHDIDSTYYSQIFSSLKNTRG